MIYRDRQEAGRLLGQSLVRFQGQAGVVILGLARGGVPVARAVAEVLQLPCDVFIVRKLGIPWQPELAMGAVAEDCEPVFDSTVFASCGVPLGALQGNVRARVIICAA